MIVDSAPDVLPITAHPAGVLSNQNKTEPLVGAPIRPSCELCVIVPVRDEALTIPAALEALATQTDLTGKPIPYERYEVIVLANNCRDASAAMARTFVRQHPGFQLNVVERRLEGAESHVGRARQMLMHEACCRLAPLGRIPSIIASTDGDTVVDAQWLAGIIAEIAAGADAVGGRILIQPQDRRMLDPSRGLCICTILDTGTGRLAWKRCSIRLSMTPTPAIISISAPAWRSPARPICEPAACRPRKS